MCKRIEIILDPSKAEHRPFGLAAPEVSDASSPGTSSVVSSTGLSQASRTKPKAKKKTNGAKATPVDDLDCRFFLKSWMMGDEFWVFLRKGWLRLGADVTDLFCGRLPRVFGFMFFLSDVGGMGLKNGKTMAKTFQDYRLTTLLANMTTI